MFTDSHCHLDAAEFDEDRERIISDAGLRAILVPAVQRANFATVRAIAHTHRGIGYALGIHPMYVSQAEDEDLDHLEASLSEYISDPQLIAVGEIGLDFFIPEISVGLLREKQERFYQAQLKLANKFGLPVILHVRRSQDVLLKYLRRIKVSGGIAHAFNGSPQQAKAFLEHGFCLGFGGAMTYSRALQIRRLAQGLPESAIVLETDAPDIPPEWLHRDFRALSPEQRVFQKRLLRNSPTELPRIAHCLAGLRECPVESVARFTNENVLRVLPRMSEVMQHAS
jgi:TatD DNase family protein